MLTLTPVVLTGVNSACSHWIPIWKLHPEVESKERAL